MHKMLKDLNIKFEIQRPDLVLLSVTVVSSITPQGYHNTGIDFSLLNIQENLR